MRRGTAALCAGLVLLWCAGGAQAAEVDNGAACAILVEADSGRVLYEKNAHERRDIASITKLMTALVAVESSPDLSRVVKVEGEWLAGAEGSSIYLAAGDELTLETLLYGMLLESGNDAAQVVAGCCAGDVETFVEWMNLRAKELGMENSHFTNPSGLSDEEHYSTAYDMAQCARACMDNATVAKIVGTRSVTLEGRTFVNHNKLLGMYDGCVGMKTGYTRKAGRTLVSCAQRDGMRLIAVTLSDGNDWEDHMALYDYGFSAFARGPLSAPEETYTLPVTGSLVRFVPVQPIACPSYPLAEGETVSAVPDLPRSVEAPVQEGSIAGKVDYYVGQTCVESVYLVYTRSVNSDVFGGRTLAERILDLIRGEARAKEGLFSLPLPTVR